VEIRNRAVLASYFEHPMGAYAAKNAADQAGLAWPKVRRVEDL